MNILLGLTGSVATTLAPKLINQLQNLAGPKGEVAVIVTESAKHFIEQDDEGRLILPTKLYDDESEWTWNDKKTQRNLYKKDDPVLHVELRKWADVLVIAPLSANTMAKMAHGICDNLLTSVFLAWDWNKPVVIAPAMNTIMWSANQTQNNLKTLLGFTQQIECVYPIEKDLACNDHGIGALANIENICDVVDRVQKWVFPIKYCSGIPVGKHPGAFKFKRKKSQHTGVDLYSDPNQTVVAVERGRIVGIEPFTGIADNSPWWNDTFAVLVEGKTGVVCYGEIIPNLYIQTKYRVSENIVEAGDPIGFTTPVLKEGREKPDIPGHSRTMLHIELYKHGQYKASENSEQDFILDPTPYLLNAQYAPPVLGEVSDEWIEKYLKEN